MAMAGEPNEFLYRTWRFPNQLAKLENDNPIYLASFSREEGDFNKMAAEGSEILLRPIDCSKCRQSPKHLSGLSLGNWSSKHENWTPIDNYDEIASRGPGKYRMSWSENFGIDLDGMSVVPYSCYRCHYSQRNDVPTPFAISGDGDGGCCHGIGHFTLHLNRDASIQARLKDIAGWPSAYIPQLLDMWQPHCILLQASALPRNLQLHSDTHLFEAAMVIFENLEGIQDSSIGGTLHDLLGILDRGAYCADVFKTCTSVDIDDFVVCVTAISNLLDDTVDVERIDYLLTALRNVLLHRHMLMA